nr:unnamed protein product [Meloidogyne enterolobii]
MFGRDPIFCIDQIIDPSISNSMISNDISEFKQKLVTSIRTAWEAAAEANKHAQLKAKEQYDKLLRNPTITVGDRVLLRNYAGKVGTSKKFHMPWKGIFRAVKIEGPHVTITSCNSPSAAPRVVHINQLKKCFEELPPACTSPKLSPEEEKCLYEAGLGGNETQDFTNNNEIEKVRNTVEREKSPELEEIPPQKQKRYNLRVNPKPRRLSIE